MDDFAVNGSLPGRLGGESRSYDHSHRLGDAVRTHWAGGIFEHTEKWRASAR